MEQRQQITLNVHSTKGYVTPEGGDPMTLNWWPDVRVDYHLAATMKSTEAWKNFNLGQELSVSGAIIYNGLRRFHEMRVLDNTDEIFEVFYNLSVGLERLLKIAVVLPEYTETTDQDKLEKSLRTDNHLDLLQRVTKRAQVNRGRPTRDSLRSWEPSTNPSLRSIHNLFSVRPKERDELCGFLGRHLQVNLGGANMKVASGFFANIRRFEMPAHLVRASHGIG